LKNKSEHKSLSEIHASVNTKNIKGWKKITAFFGPAYLISVGYMDPGNWATDIAGGSLFGYQLLWVLIMSNLIAIVLQSLSARLGIVTGKDLAQASRESYPKYINYVLYFLAELAIAACDLAEVLGMAIGIKLLFGLPLLLGVCITVLDTFLLLFLLHYGVRKMEAFIICLVTLIGVCFGIELILAKPDLTHVISGILPRLPNAEALAIAIGIIGATVMPHNLYLHSSLVQTRQFDKTELEIKKAIRFNTIDSVIALNLALFVNAGILIVAAASFNINGLQVTTIENAHELISPLLGTGLAAILFAVALIAAGQSSTITGTLAGQIIMEGYLDLRIQPWVRRLITRCFAIGPAILTILIFGDSVVNDMLIWSQILLSLQLGFAIIPLIHFVSDKKKMGIFTIKWPTQLVAWLSAITIVSLNISLVANQIKTTIDKSDSPILMALILMPLSLFFLAILLYITFKPIVNSNKLNNYIPHGDTKKLFFQTEQKFNRIAIAVDFSDSDSKAISKAVSLGGINSCYILIHAVESTNALLLGKNSNDFETQENLKKLEEYRIQIQQLGYTCSFKLGAGKASDIIPEIIITENCDILVMASHGHKGIKDMLFGTTLDKVRHVIKVPMLVANER
jgi:manganese transport protein